MKERRAEEKKGRGVGREGRERGRAHRRDGKGSKGRERALVGDNFFFKVP